MTDDFNHERELREQWQKAHQHVHEMEQAAITEAKRIIDVRLGDMNELRDQIDSERGRYVTRELYDEQHAVLRDQFDIRLKLLETAKSNMDGRLWMMGAGISAGVVFLNLVLYYFRGK